MKFGPPVKLGIERGSAHVRWIRITVSPADQGRATRSTKGRMASGVRSIGAQRVLPPQERQLSRMDLKVGAESRCVHLPAIDTMAVAHADGSALELVRDLAAKA